ncbi:unnamed protein product [Rodentolepis nana]|uniref:PI3K/PI4K catalytic domain-containing protein n=1 Tax=Rodentolepis nana TaxID=102285 RepID=A0A0R3TFV9_RODNA|nr:unnamed protein product [Rodentolepis nana]
MQKCFTRTGSKFCLLCQTHAFPSIHLANIDSLREEDIELLFEGNIIVLTSLRRPKLIRLLGSDGRWRGWLIKGGEDLRQDSNVQRLLGFANHAISSGLVGTESNTSVAPLRTYVVVPVSSQRGIIQWLDGTTTLISFCKNAMTTKELERFTELKSLDAEISRHQGDPLWRRDMESIAALVVSRFTELESFVFSLRLIRRGLFKSIATSAEHFTNLRYRLINSYASLSALCFILGKLISDSALK